jgi:D-cysteine desulfhydrase
VHIEISFKSLTRHTSGSLQRDDLTWMQLSGNKVRKLEFLIAEAKAQGADCVVTIGGVQSNHCRATAVAARYVGLDSYLILRTSRVSHISLSFHKQGSVPLLLLTSR